MRIRFLIRQLFAVALVALAGMAQALPRQIQIQKLEVPPGLPAPPGALAQLSSAVRLQASAVNFPEGAEVKLVLKVQQAGQLSCGLTPATALRVRTAKQMLFNGSDLAQAWAACRELEPGAYSLCAQFFGLEGESLSNEVCTEFNVAAPGAATDYAPPVNISPADGHVESEESLRTGIRFSWKGVEPQPGGTLTYRLRIWALPDGKEAAAVMRDSKPLLTRDLPGATETVVANALPAANIPGKVTRFVWTVQALDAVGKAVGTNAGTSKPTALVVTTYAIQLDKIAVSCTSTPGLYTFSYSLTNPNIGAAKLTAFQVTSSIPAGAVITSFAPPLNTNIPAGAQLTITGTLTASPGLSAICLGAQITDLGNSFWQASKDTCIPVKPCKCEACDPKKVNIQTPAATITVNTNNTLSLAQPLSVTTTPLKLVKSVNAELVYFAFTPDDEDCMPCNKDSRTFGNFLAGSLGPVAGTGAGTHSLDWVFSPPKNGANITPFNSTISLPPMVKCCDATVRFCIRYVITFADCTVCYKMVCYEKRLDGCSTGTPSSNNN